jgi:hypothetical protein
MKLLIFFDAMLFPRGRKVETRWTFGKIYRPNDVMKNPHLFMSDTRVNLLRIHFVHNETHMNYPGTEPKSSALEASTA